MDAENRSYLNARFGPNWQQTGFDADRARIGKELLNMESNVVSSAVNSCLLYTSKIMSSGILVDSKNAGELEQALTGKSLQKLAALLNNTGIHVRELCLIDTEGKAVYYDVEKQDVYKRQLLKKTGIRPDLY